MRVKIKLVSGGKLPEYKTKGASCCDCYAREGRVLYPHNRAVIPLGFCLELPEGYEAQIRPRSGLSKKGIDSILGTIDSDYRGEVCAIIVNTLDKAIYIEDGERVCQMKIAKSPQVDFELCEELEASERGANGFGSTGEK